jgi:hypothetical protein
MVGRRMAGRQGTERLRPRPALHSRTVVFGALLTLLAAGLLLAGHHVGMTNSGLPPEQHPSLLCDHDGLATARARVTREPYASWYERLLALSSEPWRGEGLGPAALASRAKCLALAHLLSGERRHASAAVDILRHLRPPARSGQWASIDEMVDGAASLALTYDLLAPYLRSQPALDSKVRALVAGLARGLYTSDRRWQGAGGVALTLRQYSALGLCALALSDEPSTGERGAGPKEWYRRARTGYLGTLSAGTAADGAFAEGPGLHYDAAKLYLVFAAANRSRTGDDLLEGDALRACEWGVRLRLPNGLRPSVDGSALSPSCSYAVSAPGPEGGLFRWDFAEAASEANLADDQLCEALALYDDSVIPHAPEWPPSQILATSGDAVFRSDWGADASYMLLRAEHGDARAAGGRLEQRGSASILVAKGAELLTLDGGYGGCAEQDATGEASAHSVVLVDGPGAPSHTVLGALTGADVDTSLTDVVTDRAVEAATAERGHGGVTLRRTAVFLRRRDFVVMDYVTARSGEHAFSWHLQCNAGPGTGGSLRTSGNHAMVTRPGAELQVVLTASGLGGDVELGTSRGRHCLATGPPAHPLALTAAAPRGRSAAFVSVLSPRSRAQTAPSVEALEGTGWVGVCLEGREYCLLRTAERGAVGSRHVAGDGYGLIWEEDSAGEPVYVVSLGSEHIWVRHKAVASAAGSRCLIWHAPAKGA